MEDILAKYKENYIKEMRRLVGHVPLMVIGCGVIIENEKGEILLQKRRDNGCWAILGGSMEVGEKIAETAKREVWEEALEHRFFDRANLPDNLNEADKEVIIDWAQNPRRVIID